MSTQIIIGTFIYANIIFEATYRFGGHIYNQGGYKKCLAISQGIDENGYKIFGHSYFGDDKYEVEKAIIYSDRVILHLTYPLRNRCNYSMEEQIIIFNL